MTLGRRALLATACFAAPLVMVDRLYVWSQPVKHDLSDIATGLLGITLGLFAGVAGAAARGA